MQNEKARGSLSAGAVTRRSLIMATGAALTAGLASSQTAAQQPPKPSPQQHPNLLRSPLWLCEDGFKNTTLGGQKGFQLRVRMVPYRSEPLCCVEGFQVSVDGQEFDPQSMILTLNNYNHRVPDLLTKWTRWQDVPWWFVLDRAELFIPRDTALPPGEHVVAANINVKGPFGTGGRGRARPHEAATKRLTLEVD
jgi:hypothetical protein